MALILRNQIDRKLTSNDLDGNFTYLEDLIESSGVFGDFYLTSVQNEVTETDLVTFKIPANTYKVGEINSIPSIVAFGSVTDGLSGWSDLSNLSDRNYTNFRDACNGQIGNYILGTEFVMRETTSERYWKIIFDQWTQGGNGGGFSYQRTEINPNTGNNIGSTVSFTNLNYEGSVDIIIPDVLEIKRDEERGIYNLAVEGSFNSNSSPANTEWNSIYVGILVPIIIKAYWSYEEEGKDNLIGSIETDPDEPNWVALANSFDLNQASNFTPFLSKIETETTLSLSKNLISLQTQTIADITKDIYFTLTTSVLEPVSIQTRLLLVSNVKNIGDIIYLMNN